MEGQPIRKLSPKNTQAFQRCHGHEELCHFSDFQPISRLHPFIKDKSKSSKYLLPSTLCILLYSHGTGNVTLKAPEKFGAFSKKKADKVST